MHGDSRENLMKIVVVVMIWSPISSVRGRSPSVLPYIELSYMCIYPYIQSSAIKHMYVYIKGIYTYTYTIYKYIHHTAFTLYFPTQSSHKCIFIHIYRALQLYLCLCTLKVYIHLRIQYINTYISHCLPSVLPYIELSYMYIYPYIQSSSV